MEIHSESRIAHPRDVVFAAYRDRLPEIARYIDDIREITVLERAEVDTGITLHNVWVSDRDVPKVASKFIKPEHLRWDDFADWDSAGFYCDWRIVPRAFTANVTCSGRNSFFEDGDGTIVRLTGDLSLDLKDIRGVPNFLGKRIAPQIERFIVSLITPNLKAVNTSLERFLNDNV